MSLLRDRLAVVSQEPTLFDTSIRDGSLAKVADVPVNVITDMDIHVGYNSCKMGECPSDRYGARRRV